MAISHKGSGSWAYAASGSVTTTLPTHASGDMLLVRVAYKSSAIATCAASTATSGWAKLGEFHSGTTNSGNGTGSVAVALFYKEATSSSETNPTIDFSQTVTQVGHVAIVYQKAASEGWLTPVGDGGGEEVQDAGKSFSIQSHVSVTAGDMVDIFFGVRDDCTVTVPTFTQAGVTLDTVSEQPATAGTDTSGADGAYDGAYRLASSGTSSAAAVLTCTLSTSEWAAGWQTRLRVQVATTADAGNAAGTGAASNVTTAVTAQAGAATGTGAAFTASANIQPNAGAATGTGEAFGTSTTIVSGAGAASATGAANAPSPSLTAQAGVATGTGQAFDATFEVSAPTVYADAGVATGTGAAFGTSAAVGGSAGSAAASADAFGTSTSITSSAGSASATGAANAPAPSLTVSAGHASATGAAFDAVFDSSTSAFAGVATGTGTAYGASLAITATPANAVASGQAFDATFDVSTPGTGRAARRPIRRRMRVAQLPPQAIEITIAATIPAPDVTIEGEVNDDEVVLELLMSVL